MCTVGRPKLETESPYSSRGYAAVYIMKINCECTTENTNNRIDCNITNL